MDKQLHEYPKTKIDLDDSQNSKKSSSTESPTSRSNASEKLSTLDKRIKKRQKSKSDQIHHGSSSVWKNLSHIFSKHTSANEESSELVSDNTKGSTFRRLSSIFSQRKSSKHADNLVLNVAVSPIGYQAAVSVTNFKDEEEKEIAMAVRLPSGSTTDNVAVTIVLEAIEKNAESLSNDNSADASPMKCVEETESKTVFTGVLHVPPDIDFEKLANIPLYIVDSNEQLVFQPGTEISYRKGIRPSEDKLPNDNKGDLLNVGIIKIKVKLDKVDKLQNGIKLSISTINAETKDLKCTEPEDKQDTLEKGPLDNFGKLITMAEVENKSANYLQEATNAGSISKNASLITPEEYETISNKHTHAFIIVNNILDLIENNSKFSTSVNYGQEKITENSNNISSIGYNEDESSKRNLATCTLSENPIADTRQTNMRDNWTQYSNSYFTSEKEVDVQNSFIRRQFEPIGTFVGNGSRTTSSTQTLLCLPDIRNNINNKKQRASSSHESSIVTCLPNSSNSESITSLSTILSEFSTITPYCETGLKVPISTANTQSLTLDEASSIYTPYYDTDLKVPLNTPISTVNIQESYKEMNLSINDEYTNNRSQNSKIEQPNQDIFLGIPRLNVVQSVTVNPAHYINAEEELNCTEYDEYWKGKLECEENLKYDKTASLLNAVRLKLEAYLSESYNSQQEDWCGLFSNNHKIYTVNDVRNVGVSYNNPFNSYERTDELIHKMCEESDDEHYESHRSNVSRCFQSPRTKSIKKRLYLSGDDSLPELNVGSKADQVLIMNKLPKKINDEQDFYNYPFHNLETAYIPRGINYELPVTEPVNSKLESELNTLQQMYDNMRLHMKFLIEFDEGNNSSRATIKSKAVENISNSLTSSFHELRCCLSTINQMLAHSTVSLQNISNTLLASSKEFPEKVCNHFGNKHPLSDLKPTESDYFPEVVDNASKEIADTPKHFANSPTTSELLAKYTSTSKDIRNNKPTILEPPSTTSDMLRERNNNYKTLLPIITISKDAKTNAPTSQLKSKTIYTGLPALEPKLTFSELFYIDVPIKIPEVSNSDDSGEIPPGATELFPSFSELFDDNPKQINNGIKKRPLLFENVGNVLTNNMNVFPQVPNLSTAGDNTTIESGTRINNGVPNTSYFFPDYNNFWDFSPKLSNTNLSTNTKNMNPISSNVSKTLEAVANVLSVSINKGIETTMCEKSCVSTTEETDTYFKMESEIERTIKELLKESGDIKEAIILNGGKENAEPPFSVEYIQSITQDHPLVICTNIMDEILNTVIPPNKIDTKSETDVSGPKEDVKHILDTLLEGVDNSVAIKKPRKRLELVNFAYNTTYNELGEICTNIHIGDVTNQPSSSVSKNVQNDYGTCFCSTAALTPKIPKTSFSFGETPTGCLKPQNAGCKIPVRRRDGSTTQDQERREVETSRIFTELLHLQSNINDHESNKNEDSLLEDEFCSTLDISSEFQEKATVSKFSECSTCFENNCSELHKSNTPTDSLQMVPNRNSSPMEADTNDDVNKSEDDPPTPSSDEDNNVQQSVSNKGSNNIIPKSEKHLQLTNSTNNNLPQNQPSTSKSKPTTIISTTEAEEIVQDIDLTKKTDSSTDTEFFVPQTVSGITQKSFYSHMSQRLAMASDSSSSEETASYSARKPRSKKKTTEIKEIKPITSVMSNSDSEQFTKLPKLATDSNQSSASISSQIPLKPVPAYVQLHDEVNSPVVAINPCANSNKKENMHASSISGSSSRSGERSSDTEYEGDHEIPQFNVPKPRHRYKSIPELNTPEEISLIEQNLIENDRLQRSARTILHESDTSLELEYDESPYASKNDSEFSFISNKSSIDDIIIDKPKVTPRSHSLVPSKVKPSTSK